MRLRTILFCLLVAAAVAGIGVGIDAPSSPAAGRLGEVQKQIGTTKAKIGKRRGQERVLTSTIARWSGRIHALQGRVDVLQRRQSTIQADLDVRQAQLGRTQSELRIQRARLSRLRVELARGRKLLAARLLALYEADQPDLVTVMLNSKGFADMIQRGEFIGRIQQQDADVMNSVKSARADAAAATERLDALENRQLELTTAVQKRRDEVAGVKRSLQNTQNGYRRVRAGRQAILNRVRGQRHQLENRLNELVKESNRIQGVLAGVTDTPVKQGSGRFVWPINGTITSQFCESRSWESCHPGMDIAAPMGTPIHAADTGTVRIAGWTGGYGNYTCIQHTASLSTCYGHQSKIMVTVGQTVTKGQVIGLEGSTGFSTGPHLHFEVRINGAVTNPMNYL